MTDYYVDVDGLNSNSGTTASAPWASIQKGINALKQGDNLYIMAGTYNPGADSESNGSHWIVSNKNGTSSNGITIQNYNSGQVILDGQESGAKSGYPSQGVRVKRTKNKGLRSVRWPPKNGTLYESTEKGLLEVKDCSYLTIDGLDVINSLGEGIKMQGSTYNTFADDYTGDKAADLHHITVQNCRIHNTRGRNMRISNAWDVTIDSNDMSFGSWAVIGGSGGPGVFNCFYLWFDDNTIHHQAGEAIAADGNNHPSRNVYIRNNTLWDNDGPILIHAISYVIVVGNFSYNTAQENALDKGSFTQGSSAKGITVKPSECNRQSQKPTDYILVAHNVVVDRPQGIVLKTEPLNKKKCGETWTSQPLRWVYCLYNTVVNCTTANYKIATDTAKNCVFKGNISVNSDPKNHTHVCRVD
jgi:hypothetical protein